MLEIFMLRSVDAKDAHAHEWDQEVMRKIKPDQPPNPINTCRRTP